MDVPQEGRDRACRRVHPDLGEHDLPDAGSEQAAPLETQIAALQEKVDALPEGDEARTPLEEELAAVQATLAEELAAFLGRTSRHGH